MGRYEDLMKMINPEITQQDEAQKANNPRNWLAGKVNPALDEYINPILPDSFKLNIPEMTVADQKRYDRDLPENMAGAAMGTINAKPSLGSVKVVPSAADKAADVAKASMQNKPTKASEVSEKLQSLFGEKLASSKAKVKSGEMAPSAYDIEKQGYLNKIRLGEY